MDNVDRPVIQYLGTWVMSRKRRIEPMKVYDFFSRSFPRI